MSINLEKKELAPQQTEKEELKYDYVEGIELGLKMEDVNAICVSGQNEEAVAMVVQKDYIKKQFKRYSNEALRQALSHSIEDSKKIKSRKDREMHIVWIVAWNIFDEK